MLNRTWHTTINKQMRSLKPVMNYASLLRPVMRDSDRFVGSPDVAPRSKTWSRNSLGFIGLAEFRILLTSASQYLPKSASSTRPLKDSESGRKQVVWNRLGSSIGRRSFRLGTSVTREQAHNSAKSLALFPRPWDARFEPVAEF